MRPGQREGVGGRRRKQCAGMIQLLRLLAGASAERTRNISTMSVTLEVSKLSGWLNRMYCRVERKA